jgi:hypothetical protein
MQRGKRSTLTVLALLWLGCAGMAQAQFSKKAFDAAGNSGIKSIDVLEVVQHQGLMVLSQSAQAPGVAPGAGAQTVANGIAAQEALVQGEEKLGDGFKRRNTSLSSEFTNQLVSALQAKNYEVKVLRDQKPKKNSAGTDMDMAGVNSSADAVLYVVLRFAGYKEEAGPAGLLPMVGVDAYLFSAKDNKLVYRQVFNQGARLIGGADVESLPSGPQVKFSNRNALLASIDSAVDGLVQSTKPVALRIAEQLAKQP